MPYHTRFCLLYLRAAGGLCLLGAMLLGSCKKNLSPDRFVDDQLVVLAEVTAGDSIQIPVGKTIRAGSGSLIGFQKVNDATVLLTESSNRSWALQPNWSPQFVSNPNTVFTSRKRFKADSTYSIEVRHPVLGLATAFTHIPPVPKVISIDTLSELHQGKNVLTATITWQDDRSTENFYVIEALKELLAIGHHFFYRGIRYSMESQEGKNLYEQVKNTPGLVLLRDTVSQNKFLRLYLYTQDNTSENYRIDDLANPFRRLFFEDNSFSGRSHTTRVFIDRQFFVATDSRQKGRVLLQIKSASKELFDYLFTYELYKTDFGSVTTNQLASPVGNIRNGVGVFGGSAKKQRIFYFEPL